MNDTVSFYQVRDCVREWFSRTLSTHGARMDVQIADDQAKYFRAIMCTMHYIAELIISDDSDFAPYRWISLQVLRLNDTNSNEPIFYYSDTHQDTTDDIIARLNQGLQLLLQDN